jgi:DNA polymerase-4
MPTLCRDCLHTDDDSVARCNNCGNPRTIVHPELNFLAISHVDCDAFYAAVEKRDNPSLADRPVIIGGGRRGVVSTACYIARIRGVHSAMPMFKALKACPDAVVIGPDMKKYDRVGREIRAMMQSLTPSVEPLSIDEAFLDLAGTQRLHGAPPAAVLAGFAKRVETEIGITVSVGLSHNKFLAKVASDLDKPRGFSVIGKAETLEFLAGQKVSVIWGVGRVMQQKLARDGITTIGQLQRIEEKALADRYGSIGLRLAQLSRGHDVRRVISGKKAKTISSETTFSDDLHGEAELVPILRRLAEKVSDRLKEKNLAGRTIVLKLKTAGFKLRTRNVQLNDTTQLADRIFRSGRSLLRRELDGTRFRLIGIGVGDLSSSQNADAGDFLDPDAAKRARAEHAMDAIRSRFGNQQVTTGMTFKAKPKSSNE